MPWMCYLSRVCSLCVAESRRQRLLRLLACNAKQPGTSACSPARPVCILKERAVTGLLRCPEALGVDTAWLAQRADFFCRELGMTPQEVGSRGAE